MMHHSNNHAALYQKILGLQGATFSLIQHEDATVAIVYQVILSDGKPLILKICTRPNDFFRELYYLKIFSDKLPVPKIIQTVQPQEGIYGAILMECLSGSILKTTDVTNEIAYEIGTVLARIHSNGAVGYGDLTQPHNLTLDPRVYFSMKFYEGLDECKDHLPQELIEKCRAYYEKNIYLLDLADGPCIVHRDFRPGNIIVYEGKLQGVIDWSSGRAGFAQEDFCLLEHSELPMKSSAKKALLAGYASIRPVPSIDDMMPLLRLSRAIAVIGFTVKSGTWNGKDAHIYQFNRRFLESFFENS